MAGEDERPDQTRRRLLFMGGGGRPGTFSTTSSYWAHPMGDSRTIQELKNHGHSKGRDRQPVPESVFSDAPAETFTPVHSLNEGFHDD